VADRTRTTMVLTQTANEFLECVQDLLGGDERPALARATSLGRRLAEDDVPPHELEVWQSRALRELGDPEGRNEDLRRAADRVFARALIAYGEVVQRHVGHDPVPEDADPWSGISDEGDERVRLALEASQMATWMWDLRTRAFEGDRRFRDLLGWEAPEDGGRDYGYDDFLAAVHPQDVGKLTTAVFELIAHGKRFDVEYRILVGGEVRHISSQAIVTRDDDGVAQRMFGVCLDVSAQKRLLEDMERLSSMDPLTGVLNRRGFSRCLESEVDRRRRLGGEIQALFLDLDDFKKINDVYGHTVGDEVLIAVARILQSNLRSTDHVARVGGDEFVAILPQTRRREARLVADQIHAHLQRSVVSPRFPQLRINSSIGLAAVGHGEEMVQDLLLRMERALHRAKRLGKGRVFADSGLFANEEEHTYSYTELVEELSRLENYFAVKQPIVDIQNDRLYGYELLSRSRCPALSNPEDFLNFAMDSGLAREVDTHAFHTCSKACEAIDVELSCHLNVLPSTLLNLELDELIAELPQAGDRRRFCIEISEKETIGDANKLLQFIAAIREAGMRVAMDDIGFGQSCLEALIILEPEVVKIDRNMVSDLANDSGRRRMLERLFGIARTWGADVVAEGIEREEDLRVLQDMGVPYGQGFLLGRPA